MYTFRPYTERVARLRDAVRDRLMVADAAKSRLQLEALKKYRKYPPILQKPYISLYVLERMPLNIQEDEYFFGGLGNKGWGGAGGAMWVMMDIEHTWPMGEDGLYHNPPSDELRLVMSPEDLEGLRSVRDYWKGKTIEEMAQAWHPDGYDELNRLGVRSFGENMPIVMMPAGHSTPGYAKLLSRGYASLRQEARDWLKEHRNDLMGEDAEKCIFYSSVDIVCTGAMTLLKRYSETCARAAEECSDPARKAELRQMSENLLWLSENPAQTFWQACQQTLLYEMMISMSGMTDIGSFGRFDQYTWPYLKADLEAGRITMDQAQEITDCFFMKINSFYNGGVGPLTVIIGIGNTYLHTTVGGVDPDTGEDATNPVTYMTLETLGRLSLHDPTISLRINKNTPDKLWECAIEVNKLVGGLPLFQNDDVIIPSVMKELGFTLRDARDYALIGCQEITGSGNDYAGGNGTTPPEAYTQYSTILDMALNDGVNPMNGVQAPIHTGYLYDMTSLDEVKEAWKKLARYVLKAQVSIENFVEYLFMHYDQHPILSITMEGCMESGRDIVCGGAKYNSFGSTAVGLATVADSLTTIRYMCFDKKLITTRELYDAYMANWEGHEPLRQRILKEVPHYGNADPYADEQMQWVVDTYRELCSECSSKRCRIFKGGMYSAASHVAQGYTTWATPDGRKAGKPIADAASPAQGRDCCGPTGVLSSALSFEHGRFMNGLALNIRIHPSAVNSAEGMQKLKDVTRTYMDMGGMEVQYNIISSDTMRAAQADPDSYRDLVVRIAGYSAYFNELSRDCQDDLISRTENSL